MLKYALRKILLALPLIIGVATLIFVLLELAPGNPIDRFITPDMAPEVAQNSDGQVRPRSAGVRRYFKMLYQLGTFDLGVSIGKNKPVAHLILEALPNTLMLSGLTLVVLFPVGITIGTIQAVRQGRPEDTAISVGSLFFYSMPRFWLALMLQLLLAFWLSGWLESTLPGITGRECNDMPGMISNWCEAFPLDGREHRMAFTWTEWTFLPPSWKQPFYLWFYGEGHEVVTNNASLIQSGDWSFFVPKRFFDLLWHLALPGVALGVASAAGTARIHAQQPARGHPPGLHPHRPRQGPAGAHRGAQARHAQRPAADRDLDRPLAAVPVQRLRAHRVHLLVAGDGSPHRRGHLRQGQPVIIACFVIFAVMVVIGNLVADLAYAAVDPRIKYD